MGRKPRALALLLNDLCAKTGLLHTVSEALGSASISCGILACYGFHAERSMCKVTGTVWTDVG